jgi:EAL and modified HD-GYP domain-containing signal transduction protein
MKTYISRQPVLNKKMQLGGYRLHIDPAQLRRLLEAAAGQQEDGASAGRAALTLSVLADRATAMISWYDWLTDDTLPSQKSTEGAPGAVVVVGKETPVTAADCRRLKDKGFRLAVDSAFFFSGSPIIDSADIVLVHYPSTDPAPQSELIRKLKRRAKLLAEGLDTWEDCRVARKMGYDLFRGGFFLRPGPGRIQKDVKSLDASLISILNELDTPEPSFKKISSLIEHDLALSYRLLRLVNSAYMAPKYQITSISHALSYLGTRELHQWISMLLMGGIKTKENSELAKMSLIRGKLMALITQELEIAGSGSEPFLTGLFSLIDVILNTDMQRLLSELPLSDNVKSALSGAPNELRRLLDFVINYEQACWQRIEDRYPLDKIGQEKMAALYLRAHQWAMLMD